MRAETSTSETGSELSLVAEFRLTRRIGVLLAIVSAGTFVCFVALFDIVRRSSAGNAAPLTAGSITVSTPIEMLGGLFPLAVLLVVMTGVHELVHGFFMSRYGARTTYGIGLSYLFPYAYAAGDGAVYTRNQSLIVLLSPLVVISTAGMLALLVIPADLLVVALAANAAGSTADCWMAAVLARFSSTVRVADLPDADVAGFGIYGEPNDETNRDETVIRAVRSFVFGALSTLGALLAGSVLVVLYAAAVGSGTVVFGDPDGFWFLFSHEFDPETGVARFGVGHGFVALLAVIGGCCVSVVSAVRTRIT